MLNLSKKKKKLSTPLIFTHIHFIYDSTSFASQLSANRSFAYFHTASVNKEAGSSNNRSYVEFKSTSFLEPMRQIKRNVPRGRRDTYSTKSHERTCPWKTYNSPSWLQNRYQTNRRPSTTDVSPFSLPTIRVQTISRCSPCAVDSVLMASHHTSLSFHLVVN